MHARRACNRAEFNVDAEGAKLSTERDMVVLQKMGVIQASRRERREWKDVIVTSVKSRSTDGYTSESFILAHSVVKRHHPKPKARIFGLGWWRKL
jgi:hypothetical protein